MRSSTFARSLLAATTCLVGLGCTAEIGGAGSPGSANGGPLGGGGSSGSGTGGVVAPPPGAMVDEGAGLRPLRRLGQAEYARTIESLLGSSAATNVRLPADTIGASTYFGPTMVGRVERDRIEQSAVDIASKAAGNLKTLAPACQARTSEPALRASSVTSASEHSYDFPAIEAKVAELLQ